LSGGFSQPDSSDGTASAAKFSASIATKKILNLIGEPEDKRRWDGRSQAGDKWCAGATADRPVKSRNRPRDPATIKFKNKSVKCNRLASITGT
jgi:hypothetical protein